MPTASKKRNGDASRAKHAPRAMRIAKKARGHGKGESASRRVIRIVHRAVRGAGEKAKQLRGAKAEALIIKGKERGYITYDEILSPDVRLIRKV